MPENEPRVLAREVSSIEPAEAGYEIQLSCGHIVWSAIHFTHPVVCAACINDLLDEMNHRGKYRGRAIDS